MEIKLESLTIEHAKPLWQFERENRSFFETMVPSRGDDYYIYNKFIQFLQELLKEQERGEGQYYLIVNSQNTILGRINLFNVLENPSFSAEIGYRIGEPYLFKGIASRSIEMVMKHLNKKYKKMEVIAKTTSHNYGSQKILEKNGFRLTEIEKDGATLNLELYDFLYYTWSN
ncbi:hypothetical protein JCM9140_2479 [Halalkalibacter wakoensis JCM 9140]|uniref:N-acetyltransferase domain-containing protein n=1 Tax=Halalkalibacter wakoensis JCM 9140 TaxID=1236970 RepID=W4Q384_9BACI|nr:GNAT family N-acetyltransferase [Halalkalibacter wakoensis]GAE26422.1 hypothetical protein JCM9140_2479 [Halalkalibacter wakoensis JCM 9140]